ncbi:hypothetical protein AMTRI_Chr13g89460 [Amborella trichopoda]
MIGKYSNVQHLDVSEIPYKFLHLVFFFKIITGVRIKQWFVVLDNGILQVTLSNPEGIVTGIQYGGIDNLLEILNEEDNRGYWDLVWGDPGSSGRGTFDVIKSTEFNVVVENDDQVEVSFTRTWDPFLKGTLHLEGWPDFYLSRTRVAFKLRKDKFQYMAIADNRQRIMPMPDDRLPPRGQPLAYLEAVLLVNPINPDLKGEVDDKYQYSCDNKDIGPHGWICTDPLVGFWEITPTNEFRIGGPLKQSLTSHVGPTTLAMMAEVQSWPYSFPASVDYPTKEERGSLSGRLLVRDRKICQQQRHDCGAAYVGLALPGDAGSWQRECKGYQFWTKTDSEGYFTVNSVGIGDYNLYAWVYGFIGDYKYDDMITISAGESYRQRLSFVIPNPYQNLEFLDLEFRQYGLWERYADLYPNEDLVYIVGTSDYRKDWFFAQVTRCDLFNHDFKGENGTYQATTWQIEFNLDNVNQDGTYKLRVALASAAMAELQVRFNDPKANPPHFTTGRIGMDNAIAIARHGIHGLHWLYSVDIENTCLWWGCTSPFQGILYDYIRLEGPPSKELPHHSH